MIADLNRELLEITEEIYILLGEGNYKMLIQRLAERREIFQKYLVNVGPRHNEAVKWMKRIRESEDKCIALAKEMIIPLSQELKAHRNKRRLEKAYLNR